MLRCYSEASVSHQLFSILEDLSGLWMRLFRLERRRVTSMYSLLIKLRTVRFLFLPDNIYCEDRRKVKLHVVLNRVNVDLFLCTLVAVHCNQNFLNDYWCKPPHIYLNY